MLGVMVVYHYFFNNSLSTAEKIFTVLGTLIIVDVIFFALSARARAEFDMLHFIVAYLAITLVITFWSIVQR